MYIQFVVLFLQKNYYTLIINLVQPNFAILYSSYIVTVIYQ